jgi:hypothetical protein
MGKELYEGKELPVGRSRLRILVKDTFGISDSIYCQQTPGFVI